jgi:hypothetical protein
MRLLLQFSKEDSHSIMTYLRRKENLLCRINERPARSQRIGED